MPDPERTPALKPAIVRCDEVALTLEVANDLAAMAGAQHAMSDWLRARGVGDRPIFQAELVFDEMFANTVRYGYEDAALHKISVGLELSADDLVIAFTDDAREFDPTLPRAVKAPKAIDEASIGGRGLMLVRKMAKAMQYRRSDGRNRLRIALSLR